MKWKFIVWGDPGAEATSILGLPKGPIKEFNTNILYYTKGENCKKNPSSFTVGQSTLNVFPRPPPPPGQSFPLLYRGSGKPTLSRLPDSWDVSSHHSTVSLFGGGAHLVVSSAPKVLPCWGGPLLLCLWQTGLQVGGAVEHQPWTEILVEDASPRPRQWLALPC